MRTIGASIIFLCFWSLSVQSQPVPPGGSLPINPQEKAFFDYLKQVGSIRFQDNLPTEPWIECDDRINKRTFFSAGLFQFYRGHDLNTNLRGWVASFLDHAYWAKVRSANCHYDINHFNECYAKGQFRVYFRDKRIIYFGKGTSEKYCSDE